MKRCFPAVLLVACVNLVATPETPPLVEGPGDVVPGAVAVVELGCTGCHALGDPGFAPVGPDLTWVGRKLSREWIYTRLLFPSRVVPGSRE